MLTRSLHPLLKDSLFKQKVIILYGPRQVGKTTLLKLIQQEFPDRSEYFLADRPAVKELFRYQNIDQNLSKFKDYKLILLDEAQNIPDIGTTLKIIHDTDPKIQIIATGSSSFDLSNETQEPLTGRSIQFEMYPLTLTELATNMSIIDQDGLISDMLIYGSYPEVRFPGKFTSLDRLQNIASNYLYKDVLSLVDINKPELLEKLLQALALQIGSEVSYSELANLLDVSIPTIERYINLLEKSFIIFKLRSLARNHRTEINKSRKIYFWDLGIRNYLINNFNQLRLRDDVGKLWENFCVLERIKYLKYSQILAGSYFWRNYAQAEIDYIEESGGSFDAFEFKFNPKKKARLPKNFDSNYKVRSFQVISPSTIFDFVTNTK
jgi:predicted AAA+ superfamily ATPase